MHSLEVKSAQAKISQTAAALSDPSIHPEGLRQIDIHRTLSAERFHGFSSRTGRVYGEALRRSQRGLWSEHTALTIIVSEKWGERGGDRGVAGVVCVCVCVCGGDYGPHQYGLLIMRPGGLTEDPNVAHSGQATEHHQASVDGAQSQHSLALLKLPMGLEMEKSPPAQ